ncbi:LexA family protein [Lactiplantibacillus paraplantarum]|uniref:Bifunctional S24 family peptidase/transcriptional regulator n=2 Tax=Lactiplantibacillus paraplantarum TaxID=60520 RepID=A0A2I9DU20_9LACO|nr:XRE family transcriptional regulator [Lactiplantibacillus paraplantarum]AVW11455.1 XRE family transcriptional regulator [Lactiplantibacillus paraplantarum]AYJ39874.1 XRE family transcriptional regulator [Lactiplantibacillus paraplantarum]ERL44954.1 Transcriptional regulator, XRE [Lactiplantibacillus paraplantarum]KRL48941.1 peptidase s24-like protein [Lactiplantibacillus paraplantarum DSM 10667]MCU4684937.1 XRE family transcriptional regulator [Lactiplantibacillus paraplantarum]
MNNNDIFANNLKKLLADNQISRKQLSIALNVKYTTLADWLNARTFPRIKSIEKIANYFSIPKSFLIEDSSLNFISKNDHKDIIVKIPIIGNIAGGSPIFAEQNIDGTVDEVTSGLPSGENFYLRLVGQSMSPTIPNGSLVLIHRQPDVEDGEIAAVQVDNDTQATLKRVIRKNDTVILNPDNPAYQPIVLDDSHPGRIIGKAIRYTVQL